MESYALSVDVIVVIRLVTVESVGSCLSSLRSLVVLAGPVESGSPRVRRCETEVRIEFSSEGFEAVKICGCNGPSRVFQRLFEVLPGDFWDGILRDLVIGVELLHCLYLGIGLD